MGAAVDSAFGGNSSCMHKTDVTAPLEELLEHANWVRRLAGGLVAGPHDADDITQDVWQAVLANETGAIASPRGWLAGAVRNVANMRRRSSGRREQREQQAAKPQQTPSTAELVAEQELRTNLIKRVDSLPQGEREVVLLRFWRNMPPREVAKQLGIPVNTVRSRTARALERLREQLDDQHGDRRTWCLMLVPLLDADVLRASSLAPATSGAKVMVLAASAALALVVGGYTAYAHYFVYSPPSYSSSEPVTALLDSFDAPVVATGDRDDAPIDRQAALPANATKTLGGQVVDLDGQPIAGAFVHREAEWFEAWIRYGKITAEDWSATTDLQGHFTLPPNAFDFRPPTKTVMIGEVTHQDYVAELGWTDCAIGEPARFVMRPTITAMLELEVVEKGTNIPVSRFGVSLRSSWGEYKWPGKYRSDDPGRRSLTSIDDDDISEHGVAGKLTREVRLVTGAKNLLEIHVAGLAPIIEELPTPTAANAVVHRRYEVDLEAHSKQADREELRGTIVDALTGKPIDGAYVSLVANVMINGHRGTRSFRTASRVDGSWRLHYDPSLPADLVSVAHPEYTRQGFRFKGEDSLELRVLPLAALELTVATDGRPRSGVHVLLRHAQGQQRAVSDEQGRVHVTGLPVGTVSIDLVPNASSPDEHSLDSVNLSLRPGETKQYTFAFASPDLVTVQGKVFGCSAIGVPIAPAFIPLDNDHGWVRARSPGGGSYQAGGMRRGRYLVFLLPTTDDHREGPFALAGTIKIDDAISQVVDLELPRGKINGRLHGVAMAPELSVVAIPDLPTHSITAKQLLSSSKFASMIGATVASDGRFQLSRVVDGNHLLQLRRGTEVLATRKVDVQGGLADIGDWLINQ